MLLRIFLFVSAFLISPSVAAEQIKRYGTWEVSREKDAFEGKPRVLALTVQKGPHGLGVRCLDGNLSITLSENPYGERPYVKGTEIHVKFRVDQNEIVDNTAIAITNATIEFDVSRYMIQQMQKGTSAAFRISTKGVRVDRIFKLGAANRALAEILAACPDAI